MRNKLLLTLLVSAPLWAQVTDPFNISWTNATLNEDNTPLTDLDGTELECRDTQGAPLFTFDVQDPAITSVLISSLPTIPGTEYTCVGRHYDESGNFSVDSNSVVWSTSGGGVPDTVAPKALVLVVQ